MDGPRETKVDSPSGRKADGTDGAPGPATPPLPTPLANERGAFAAPSAPSLLDFDSRYRFVEELARGGMGRVWVAEDQFLRREVAVKEVLGPAHGQALLRFEREALITARLQHPGIIAIYEYGKRPSGDAVLVMRRVRGESLDKLISRAVTMEKRLALLPQFTAAVDAVAFAHREGVVHRDLKPDNVLLGEFGDTVVIDWGLAKDLRAPDSLVVLPPPDIENSPTAIQGAVSAGALTHAGALMGTPEYMSPEQARREPADARSDVYALGAMLYHLLAGQKPFKSDSVSWILAMIQEGTFEPLGERAPGLAPELVTIVERAMAREPAQRYPTAAALAEDLKHFQAGRLVLAHSYSTSALLLRWARRHTIELGLTAAFLIALGVGGTIAVRRVLREAATSRRVSELMTDMFKVADPSEARGNSITAREVLDKAAANIDQTLADEPAARARLLLTMGQVYKGLGLYPRARELLEKAVAAQEQLGVPEAERLRTAASLALTYVLTAKYKQADALVQDALPRAKQLLGETDPTTLLLIEAKGLSFNESGRFKDAELVFRELLATRTRLLGPENADTLAAQINLASTLSSEGKYSEAEPLLERALAISQRTQGADAPHTIKTTAALGIVYYREKRYPEAEKTLRAAVDDSARVLGKEHPNTLLQIGNLANVYFDEKRYGEAIKLYEPALAISRKTLGAEHPDTLMLAANLAEGYAHDGKLDESEELLNSLVKTERQALGPNSDILGGTLYDLGIVAVMRGQLATAVLRLRDAVNNGLPHAGALEMEKDEELAPLKGREDFARLVDEVKAHK